MLPSKNLCAGGARGPVTLPAFKAGDPVHSGPGGGFDSHTLPPYLSSRTGVAEKRGGKRRH